MIALENIPNFTRIVLMNVPYKESEINKPCISKYKDILIYSDMVCVVISLVFNDIPRLYQMVIKNKELANLTIEGWLKALLMLAVPILQIDTASASEAPSLPGAGGLNIDYIIGRARQEIINSAATEIQYHLESAEKLVNQVKALLEQNLTNLIKQRKYRKHNNISRKRQRRTNYVTH